VWRRGITNQKPKTRWMVSTMSQYLWAGMARILGLTGPNNQISLTTEAGGNKERLLVLERQVEALIHSERSRHQSSVQ